MQHALVYVFALVVGIALVVLLTDVAEGVWSEVEEFTERLELRLEQAD